MRGWLTLACLLFASPVWAASLEVSWTAPTTNADGTPLTDLAGYRLYLETPCPSPQHATVAAPATSVTVNDLAPSTTYTARITAVDTGGNESACSAPASGTTLAATAPAGLVGTMVLRFDPDPAPPTFSVAPATLTFAWTVGQPLPAAHTVTISGGTGPWTTQDTNPWADAVGGSWDGVLSHYPASSASFGVRPSSGMLALAPGTYSETITVRRGVMATAVTVRVVVAP